MMPDWNFQHYNNPQEAQKIAEAYRSEPVNMNVKLIDDMSDAIAGHNKCADLDYFLYNLFLRHETSSCSNLEFRRVNKRPTDEEKGIESVARKHYEENTTHNPLQVV